jgi:hypothetical protein
MDELCDESGVIYVLDRGYVDYNSLYGIELQGPTFVTRIKSNGAFKRIKNDPHEKDRAILSDVLIRLMGPKTKKQYPKPIWYCFFTLVMFLVPKMTGQFSFHGSHAFSILSRFPSVGKST